MATLLYGAGLRLSECLALRVKDLEFGNYQVIVRGGKGAKDGRAPLPESLVVTLTGHLEVTHPHVAAKLR